MAGRAGGYRSRRRYAMDGRESLGNVAGVAQVVEQLTCNQPVGGSNPLASSRDRTGTGGGIRRAPRKSRMCVDIRRARKENIGPFSEAYPSGQRDQTVNLTRYASEVRILPPPPNVGGVGKRSRPPKGKKAPRSGAGQVGGYSSTVEPQPSKLIMRVRFPLPAPECAGAWRRLR